MKISFAEKYLLALFIFLWISGTTLLILNDYFNLTPPIKPLILSFIVYGKRLMGKNKLLLPIILIIFAILAVFCALTLKIGFVVTIKLFSSFLLVFFVPGIIWSFAILGEGKQIAWILRLVFAFAFSIFSVPLIEFYS